MVSFVVLCAITSIFMVKKKLFSFSHFDIHKLYFPVTVVFKIAISKTNFLLPHDTLWYKGT